MASGRSGPRRPRYHTGPPPRRQSQSFNAHRSGDSDPGNQRRSVDISVQRPGPRDGDAFLKTRSSGCKRDETCFELHNRAWGSHEHPRHRDEWRSASGFLCPVTCISLQIASYEYPPTHMRIPSGGGWQSTTPLITFTFDSTNSPFTPERARHQAWRAAS
jgi:hypothetical protein